MDEAIWITRRELASRQNLPVATLAQWASQGKGPRYAKFGGLVRYRLADVIAWENANTVPRADEPHGAGAA
jgi:hypothetical protein